MNPHRVVMMAALLVCATAESRGGERPAGFWVDNVRGDDGNPGTETMPFATVGGALKKAGPGVTIHLVPTGVPYPPDISVRTDGTPDAPLILDGHGSVVSGRRRFTADAWKDEGGGVYSRVLENNAWGMQRHWEGGFPLVWFDGTPGTNVTSREDLTPGAFFLYKNRKKSKQDPLHNTLFMRLPAGTSFGDVRVESIAGDIGVQVLGDHVTVRNVVCEYGGRDGFSTRRNTGVLFENVEARYFMDQGISNHGAAAVVRHGHFHHNAGCGIVDVYGKARVRYEKCLVEFDTWRGGVEFHRGAFEMVDCLIRGNRRTALSVARGARVRLSNCLLVAPTEHAGGGVSLGRTCLLTIERCTLYGFPLGLQVRADAAGGTLTVRDSVFARCATNMKIIAIRDAGAPELDLARIISAGGNRYEPAPFSLSIRRRPAPDAPWTIENRTYSPVEYSAFAERIGADPAGELRAVNAAANPRTLSRFTRADDTPVGASLPPDVGVQDPAAAAKKKANAAGRQP